MKETLRIGDKVNFIHSTNIEGEKKIMQGKINKILGNNCVLIEVINHYSRNSYNGTLCNRKMADIV
jgi:hypothetical protein